MAAAGNRPAQVVEVWQGRAWQPGLLVGCHLHQDGSVEAVVHLTDHRRTVRHVPFADVRLAEPTHPQPNHPSDDGGPTGGRHRSPQSPPVEAAQAGDGEPPTARLPLSRVPIPPATYRQARSAWPVGSPDAPGSASLPGPAGRG
jgi:hypothetical protein